MQLVLVLLGLVALSGGWPSDAFMHGLDADNRVVAGTGADCNTTKSCGDLYDYIQRCERVSWVAVMEFPPARQGPCAVLAAAP